MEVHRLGSVSAPASVLKRCYRCNQQKPLDAFNACKSGTHGRHGHCRSCQKNVRREWYSKNSEQEKDNRRAYGKSEKAIVMRRARYAKNRDKLLERNRQYRATPAARAKAAKARLAKETRDPSAKLARNLRVRLRKVVVGINRSASTMALLGCTIPELKKHLEQQFAPGMSWENYGYRGWHIDHKLPCASFDLTRDTDQKTCFHFSNLRPMWRFENQSKGSRTLEHLDAQAP